MGEKIYGVDLEGKITPLAVRDAIIVCFKEAHREVLDMTDEFAKWDSPAECEKFRKMEIEAIVKGAFEEARADFANPRREDLIKAIDSLAKLALQFRNRDIVEKHYGEIKRLIDRMEGEDDVQPEK